jgi:acetolactate synthase-1/2/3 large subunit
MDMGEREQTGGDALITALVDAGVDTIFGVPGIQLDGALDALVRAGSPIRFLSLRHEQATTYMADGYARASGRPGVAMVVPGPGVLNATAGLATAYACSSPVVALVGQVETAGIGRPLGLLHEIRDQSAIIGALTKSGYLASAPDEVAPLIRTAFGEASSGRPRPVAVELPVDVLHAPVRSGAVSSGASATGEPAGSGAVASPEDDLERLATMLLAARRPVLYVGGGINGAAAYEELLELARLLDAPVVMSLSAPGVIPSDDPLALTHATLDGVSRAADLVVAIGTRFLNRVGRPELPAGRVPLALINVDAEDLGAPREADLTIRSDARTALRALLTHVGSASPSSTWTPSEIAEHRTALQTRAASLAPQRRWLDAIRSAMPRDSVFVSEMTQMGYVSNDFYPVHNPRGYITPGYQGTLGYGYATALGAQVGAGSTPVVSVTGDGGFGWTLQELATQAKYAIPLATVVFRDDVYGNVKRIQENVYGGRHIGIDLHNPDFVKLAEAFGIEAARIADPEELESVLGAAVLARTPILIDAPVGTMPDPWPIIG